MAKLEHQITYINMIIKTFAEEYNMTRRETYAYLKKYKGLDALIEFIDINICESELYVVEELVDYCKRNGGNVG